MPWAPTDGFHPSLDHDSLFHSQWPRARCLRHSKRGDHVEWNSEAGRVRGVILKKVVSDVRFKGYVHHATKDEPQYFIKSDETDHIAIHKGAALLKARPRKKAKKLARMQRTKH